MMPLNRMARSVFISVFLLGAIDLYAAEQPELIEQKPQYIRTKELPALKISFADMQSILEKAANLLSVANANPAKAKPKEFFFHETLKLGREPDEIEIAGHSFPANVPLPKAAYALSYSYTWIDAPVSKLDLDLRDFLSRLVVSGTSVDQVEAISAAVERDLLQHSAIGGSMLRDLVRFILFAVFLMALLVLEDTALPNVSGALLECPYFPSSDWSLWSLFHSMIC